MIRSLTLAMLAITPVVYAAEEPPLRFETHVRPILKKHCFHCHGEESEIAGKLDVRLVRLMMAGGDSGTAIAPGNPEESLLYQRLRDGEMPPDESKHLSAKEILIIRDWITAGASTARAEPESVDALPLVTDEEKSHWAFQPIRRTAVPTVNSSDLVANPIDSFLLARLESAGHEFAPPASRRTLIRRATFDLLGLPPTPEAVDSFEQNADSNAWESLIESLLKSPRHGEHWAQHWLDVAGYADSEGYTDRDTERQHAWRYRDYVINAFNNDKPFDEFIVEQLAGDELLESPLNNLAERDVERLTATGFLRTAPDGTGDAVTDAAAARNETIADTIRIVSSSLMGLTVGCAQCHNHRYDPISQEDYYRFRAIFDPALDWKKWKKPAQRRVSLYTDEDRAAAAAVEAEAKEVDVERSAKQSEFIAATFEKQLADLPAKIHDTARLAHKTAAAQRTDEQKALFKRYPQLNVTSGSLYLYDRKAADELKAMAATAADIRSRKPPEGFVRALMEVPGQLPTSHLFSRGDHEQPRQEVQPAGLTVLSLTADLEDIPNNEDFRPGSGRRLALSKRLTSPAHPLTARVIVNRVWMHHFGRGLVSTPSDFGTLGSRPTHPLLLDWLSAEFMDSGWSIRHLHQLILNSTAWQQQTMGSLELEQADPENHLYGRAQLRRLDAEVVRDAMLLVSGKLNDKAFGPPVPVMADLVGRIVVGKQNYKGEAPGEHIDMKGEQFRRSIYVQARRSRPLSVLQTFDRPQMSPNCDMRRPSTGSPQSLLMMNSDLVQEYSRDLAGRLESDVGEDPLNQIRRAWQLIYARTATDAELLEAMNFVDQQAAIFAKLPVYQPEVEKPPPRTPRLEAMSVLCQMLFSSNEFLYVN